MYRHAVIDRKTGQVVNVIMYDGVSQWAPPQGHHLHKSEECDIGDTFDFEKNVIVRADRTSKD